MSDTPETPPRGLRALVYDRLPPAASPTGTLCQPLPRHVIERAQGDVVELTARKVSDQLREQPHIVLTIRDGDLDPRTDGDLLRVLEQTQGGVLVFGVSFVLAEPPSPQAGPHQRPGPRVEGESCPECGSTDAFEVDGGEPTKVRGVRSLLVECGDCGAVWDT